MANVTDNERSWGLDLISHINEVVRGRDTRVRRAGGEKSLRAGDRSLFPDVLLYGDVAGTEVLQGWELKYPDTSIDDPALHENAAKKAVALGLSSYLVWNVRCAQLCVRDAAGKFVCVESWDDLVDITTREEVRHAEQRWKQMAEAIVDDLNDRFVHGMLVGRPIAAALQSDGIVSLLLSRPVELANTLRDAASRDQQLEADLQLWWDLHRHEYDYRGSHRTEALAQLNLFNWIAKLHLAHVLQRTTSAAAAVNAFSSDLSPLQALQEFERMSQTCDFAAVFTQTLGQEHIPPETWKDLLELNDLLASLRVSQLSQRELSDVMEASVIAPFRKRRGQYTTPPTLAQLLVRICVDDVVEDRVLDPCCGSGTIVRAALEQKLQHDVEPALAAQLVVATDNDPLAVQIAMFAMAKPELTQSPLRAVCHNALLLEPQGQISLTDPQTGHEFEEAIGTFDAVVSNLPFVSSRRIPKHYKPVLESIDKAHDLGLTGRADLCAYFPFALLDLMPHAARLGIIITNAWLGTAWGDAFTAALAKHYHIRCVITSAKGRWFQNSDVVANLLVLERRIVCETTASTSTQEPSTDYISLQCSLDELADEQTAASVSAHVRRSKSSTSIRVNTVSQARLLELRKYGLGGNAQFARCDWIMALLPSMVRLTSQFDIRRGERRGWNDLFYPDASGQMSIEDEYLRPVVRSPSGVVSYIHSANALVFCCSHTEAELEHLGHDGALGWIDKFKRRTNSTGRPLPDVLRQAQHHWYEFRARHYHQFILAISPGDRIFFARLDPPSLIDQRWVGLTVPTPKLPDIDLELCHAILNCTVSLFMIEGLGFGRGQGALDLNKDRIEAYFHMLDPSTVSVSHAIRIKEAFARVCARPILTLAEEVAQDDRRQLDLAVLEALGVQSPDAILTEMYHGTLELLRIRQVATDPAT